MLITIVELPEFQKRAEKILTNKERNELLFYLSTNPESGDLIKGSGGIRKLRWRAKGKGKSGGSRIIFFFMIKISRCFYYPFSLKMKK